MAAAVQASVAAAPGAQPGAPKDVSRWMCLYPCYLDSSKRLSEGRRVAKAHGCDKPTVWEMLEICKYLKLDGAVEDKCHPRNPKWERGRLRVRMKDDNRDPTNAEVPNRRAVLKVMGKLIPNLTLRKRRLAAIAERVEQVKKMTGGGAGAGAGGKRKGKKGKKKWKKGRR